MPNNKSPKARIRRLFKMHIQGTQKEAFVVVKTISFCYLTKIVMVELKKTNSEIKDYKVYLTTKMLKHCFDRKTAEVFDFLLDNLNCIISYPEKIYKNKSMKRGDFGFVKTLKGDKYFSSLEFDNKQKKMFVVTSFRLKNDNYLQNYELLWSWEDGTPPS